MKDGDSVFFTSVGAMLEWSGTVMVMTSGGQSWTLQFKYSELDVKLAIILQ